MLEPATARMVWSLSERSAEITSVAPVTGRALRATSLNGCFRAEREFDRFITYNAASSEDRDHVRCARFQEEAGAFLLVPLRIVMWMIEFVFASEQSEYSRVTLVLFRNAPPHLLSALSTHPGVASEKALA